MLRKLIKHNLKNFGFYRHRVIPENRFSTPQYEDVNNFKNYPTVDPDHFSQKLPYHEI